MKYTTTAQHWRDITAITNKKLRYEQLENVIDGKMLEAAKSGKYKVTIPFEELNASDETIKEFQRIARLPHSMLDVVIQTQDQAKKELVIKWG